MAVLSPCREKKQKIQDIRKNVKDAIVVSITSQILNLLQFHFTDCYMGLPIVFFFTMFMIVLCIFSPLFLVDYSVGDEHFNTPSPTSQPWGPIQNRIHQKHSTSLWLWLFTGKKLRKFLFCFCFFFLMCLCAYVGIRRYAVREFAAVIEAYGDLADIFWYKNAWCFLTSLIYFFLWCGVLWDMRLWV